MKQSHEFAYCHAVWIPRYVYIPEHDGFGDGLSLNYEAIEPENVALFALHLIGKDKKPAIDTTGMEFVPECGVLKTPELTEVVSSFLSSTEIDTPTVAQNVYFLDDYRGGDNAA